MLSDLRRVATRLLAKRCRFSFLLVLVYPAFALGDLFIQPFQFVLGFVELLDDFVVLSEQLAIYADLSHVGVDLVSSLENRVDVVVTDVEK